MAIFRMIAGLVIAVLGTALLINIGQKVLARVMPLELPGNPTPADLERAMDKAHSSYFLVLLAGYLVSVGLGTMLAGLVSRWPRLMAWTCGLLFVAASGVNLMAVRHPGWFAALNIAGVIAAAWTGQRVARVILSRGAAPRSQAPSAS